MKAMILAAAAVVAFGMGTAFAGEGEGGYTADALQWQAANGNPTIPASQWFAMTPNQREALVQQLQQQAATAIGIAPAGVAVTQSHSNPRG